MAEGSASDDTGPLATATATGAADAKDGRTAEAAAKAHTVMFRMSRQVDITLNGDKLRSEYLIEHEGPPLAYEPCPGAAKRVHAAAKAAGIKMQPRKAATKRKRGCSGSTAAAAASAPANVKRAKGHRRTSMDDVTSSDGLSSEDDHEGDDDDEDERTSTGHGSESPLSSATFSSSSEEDEEEDDDESRLTARQLASKRGVDGVQEGLLALPYLAPKKDRRKERSNLMRKMRSDKKAEEEKQQLREKLSKAAARSARLQKDDLRREEERNRWLEANSLERRAHRTIVWVSRRMPINVMPVKDGDERGENDASSKGQSGEMVKTAAVHKKLPTGYTGVVRRKGAKEAAGGHDAARDDAKVQTLLFLPNGSHGPWCIGPSPNA